MKRAGALIFFSALLISGSAEALTTYLDGVSPPLAASPPGTFDLGTHLPSYIGPTVLEGNGTLLDGTRVFFFDCAYPVDSAEPKI